MKKKYNILIHGMRAVFKHPVRVFKNFNLNNLRILFTALKNEPPSLIISNFYKKLGLNFSTSVINIPEKSIEDSPLLHPTVFEPKFYFQYYTDLHAHDYNEEFLKKHWLNFGISEKRIASPSFDLNFYLDVYTDVRKYAKSNAKKAVLHWVNFGLLEGRIGSICFDQTYYRSKNKDVDDFAKDSNELCFKHWYYHGIKESRPSSPFINLNTYKSNNRDLRSKFKNNLDYLVHLHKYGLDEKRDFSNSLEFQSWSKNRNGSVYWTNYFIAEKYLVEKHPSLLETKDYSTYSGEIEMSHEKRNIVFIAHSVSNKIYGGERSFLDLIRATDKKLYNIYVCLPRFNKNYLGILEPLVSEVFVFKYGWWSKNNTANKKSIEVFEKIFLSIDADLVHSNTIMLLDPIAAAKNLDIPSLVHVREIISKDSDLCSLFDHSAKEVIQLVKDHADHLIVNSDATKLDFFKESYTHKLYNTIENKFFESKSKTSNKSFVISMLSSNIPKKGIRDFVLLAEKTFQRDQDIVFRMIGERTKWVEEFDDKLKSGLLKANLEFPGYIEDTLEVYEESDILVNFSHFAESFGRTIVEAMSTGVVPLVYDYGALSELVEHKNNGLKVPYKKWENALDLILELKADNNLLKEIRKNSIEFSHGKFKPEYFSLQLNEIYKNLVRDKILYPYSNNQLKNFEIESQAAFLNSDPLYKFPPISALRIAYFVYHFPVPSETFVLNELKYLVNQGYDVIVYCKASPWKDFKPDFEIEVVQVKTSKELTDEFIKTKRNVAHSIFTYPTVTDFLWPACEEAQIPFTFAAHAAGIFKYENQKKNRIKEISESPFCLRILVPGKFHKNYLVNQGLAAGKLIINPQVIDNSIYLGYDRKEFKKYKAICVIGRYVEKKGYEYLIRAMVFLKDQDIKLNIYGYGELEEEYKGLIKELDLDNVFLKGGLKGAKDIIQAFQENDVFIQPSVRATNGDMDGIPTILIEAMSFGIPVMTSAISSIPELVQDKLNGYYLPQKSPEGIARIIKSYYEQTDYEIQKLVNNAKEKVNKFFDIASLMQHNIRLWKRESLDLVLVTYDNYAELQEIIKRLYCLSNTRINITIADNNSSEKTKKHLAFLEEQFLNLSVVFNKENLFVGPGTNIAIEQGSNELIVYICAREGMVVNEGWERKIYDTFEKNEKIGLAGTLGYSPSYMKGKDYPQGIKLFEKFRSKEFAFNNPDRQFYHVQGGLFALRRKMYDAIGGFSEAVPHHYTDVEYTFFAESQDWKIIPLDGVLALYNKTIPSYLSRVDEDVFFTHPPSISELPYLDVLRNKNKGMCNICNHLQRLEFDSCAQCSSTPEDRAAYRHFSESTYSYRRLRSLYINPSAALRNKYWDKSFQGRSISFEDISLELQENGKIVNNDRSFDLILLSNLNFKELNTKDFLNEMIRCLNEESSIFYIPYKFCDIIELEKVVKLFEGKKLSLKCKTLHSSELVDFNNTEIFEFKRIS